MKTIFINGTFDILHSGHLKLFSLAKGLGDHVFVAIDSDARVRKLKGADRPVNNQIFRRELIQAILPEAQVCIFNSNLELEDMICRLQPIMLKGSDYINKPIIGREFCQHILFLEKTDDSTTKIIERISNR